MRAVVQRVSEASVSIEGNVKGSIGKGFMVLLGVEDIDEQADLNYICEKLTGLRVFEDSEGKMNLSITDIGGVTAHIPVHPFRRCPQGQAPQLHKGGEAGKGHTHV